MSDQDHDLAVAGRLGRIEGLLHSSMENQDRFERRLIGEDGNPNGGIIGDYDRRIKSIEVWFIRITTAVIVFDFMTGAGPLTLSGVLRLLGKG